MKLAPANEVFNRVGRVKDFALRQANARFVMEAKALADDPREAISELGRDGILDFGRESGNHPLKGFGRG